MGTCKVKVRSLLGHVTSGLIERDDAVKLALLASFAGEHLLLVGPPGTAKSEVARRLRQAFSQATYFERLLTRFSVPEELFGPLSIKALEEDRYERKIVGYLPTASIAFIDEIFKANSAILNSLLTLLNERKFDNGTERLDVPLISVVGASNELPDGEELAALYDRFLLRLYVEEVSEAGFDSLLALRGGRLPEPPSELRLGREELLAVRAGSESVRVPASVTELLKAARTFCRDKKIQVSDRRWRQIVKLLQASAFTDGRDEVVLWDGWLLQHCLWQKPEQRPAVRDWFYERVGVGAVEVPDAGRIQKILETLEVRLSGDLKKEEQQRDAEGRLLFVDPKGVLSSELGPQKLDDYGRRLFRADIRGCGVEVHSEDVVRTLLVRRGLSEERIADFIADRSNWAVVEHRPSLGPARYSAAHVAGRKRQLEELLSHVEQHATLLSNERARLAVLLKDHLWIDPAFHDVAAERLGLASARIDRLRERIAPLAKLVDSLAVVEE